MRTRSLWLLFGLGLVGSFCFLCVSTLRAAGGNWRETGPGIETAAISVRSATGKVPVIAARVDPARCAIRLVDAHRGRDGTGALAADVCPKVGVAINASFFAEDLTPIGLLIVDGKQVRPFHADGAWGYFLMRNGKPSLAKATRAVPSGVSDAVQSKPRLVVNGALQTFKQQPPACRSAVGIDASGRVVLAASDGLLTLEEWAACLRNDLGCPNALNLDGGPSTQLEVRGRLNRSVKGVWPVPTFITITPREQKK